MKIVQTSRDPSQDRQGPLTYVTQDTHWWDGSQIYGNTKDYADALRMVDDKGKLQGKLDIDDLGLAQRDEVDRYLKYDGPTGNFWIGLAILHSLFMREHNAICERLAAEYPD